MTFLSPCRTWRSSSTGILSSSQALTGGLSRDVIRSRVRNGRWRRLHWGVYAVFSGDPGRQATLWAAVLHAGRGAMLSYQTAGELAGLTDGPSTLIHITIPGDRRITKIPGMIIHVARYADQARHPTRTPPMTRIEETVLDLAHAAGTPEIAYGWVTRALGRRLTTQARLREAMAARGRLRWRPDLAEALGADRPASIPTSSTVTSAISSGHTGCRTGNGRCGSGRTGTSRTAMSCTRSTGWPLSWTAARLTQGTCAGMTSDATMRPPRRASSRCGTAGSMSPGVHAQWPLS